MNNNDLNNWYYFIPICMVFCFLLLTFIFNDGNHMINAICSVIGTLLSYFIISYKINK